MKKRVSPAVISSKLEKAQVLREIAGSLNFGFREELLESQGIVRFHFSLSSDDIARLVQMVPRDVYAFRGVVAADPKDLST